MHVSAVLEIQERLLPALHYLHQGLHNCEKKFGDIIKIGRTHLQVCRRGGVRGVWVND